MRRLALVLLLGCGSEFQAGAALEVELDAGSGGREAGGVEGNAGESHTAQTDAGPDGYISPIRWDGSGPIPECTTWSECSECGDLGTDWCGADLICLSLYQPTGGVRVCMPPCQHGSECESGCCAVSTVEGPGVFGCVPVGHTDPPAGANRPQCLY